MQNNRHSRVRGRLRGWNVHPEGTGKRGSHKIRPRLRPPEQFYKGHLERNSAGGLSVEFSESHDAMVRSN